jgi:dTDP-4-amino-4,6-dideoxygalactose transaminase
MSVKSKLSDLAIFGGQPAFDEKLHVGRPNIGDRQHLMERLNDILDRQWLTNDGPYVQEFECKIADFVGVKHCVAVCNATTGLQIAIRALQLSGEVILPSMTFIATAHALQWQNITPVFCDIDPETWNIEPRRVEEMITPRTTGIIGVHLFARPCDVDALADIARQHKLRVLYDAAHAFGCSVKSRMIGGFGDAEVFSFHATKFFNSLEGGAVVTNNDDLAVKMRLMRNFGFSGYDKVICIGTNGKMNEFSAVMGLTSFESLGHVVETNRHNYFHYQTELANLPGVTLIAYNEAEKCNFQYVVLEIDEELTHISRDQLVESLWAENVIARRYFYPGCHRMEPYCSLFPYAGLHLPVTERVANQLLCLPTGTSMDDEKISRLAGIIRYCVSHGSEIGRTLFRQMETSDDRSEKRYNITLLHD